MSEKKIERADVGDWIRWQAGGRLRAAIKRAPHEREDLT